jgi:N-succinyldiaminopimelate aminotransferase
MFSSLSKRSNVPGLRSGFVAGDAAIIKQFLLYRTYHGSAMGPPVQAASWRPGTTRPTCATTAACTAEKFDRVTPHGHAPPANCRAPMLASTYGRARRCGDTEFAADLLRKENVAVVLPGSYLARDGRWRQPRRRLHPHCAGGRVEECIEAAERIAAFCASR